MSDNKQLDDALQQLDTFSKAYVRVREITDLIKDNNQDVKLGVLSDQIHRMLAINKYFCETAAVLDTKVRSAPRSHIMQFEYKMVMAVCEFTAKLTESTRLEVGEVVSRAVLGPR